MYLMTLMMHIFHVRIQKVLSEGSNFASVIFFLEERGSKQIRLQAGHNQLASKMRFKWPFVGVQMIAEN